jgi:hypothetical protein
MLPVEILLMAAAADSSAKAVAICNKYLPNAMIMSRSLMVVSKCDASWLCIQHGMAFNALNANRDMMTHGGFE